MYEYDVMHYYFNFSGLKHAVIWHEKQVLCIVMDSNTIFTIHAAFKEALLGLSDCVNLTS